MKKHWIWCVCVTVACAVVGSIELASADEPTGESCPADCEKGKAERDAICGSLPAQEARQRCLQEK